MSRLLLLSILVLWMCPRDDVSAVRWSAGVRVGVFLGAYALLVGLVSGWSRWLARRAAEAYLGRALDHYNRATELARYFVPVWLAVGIFVLGWGRLVHDWLAPLDPATAPKSGELFWRLPGLLVGTLPAFVAWMGLWWAQYPADRALKEQSVLYQANEGMPIHAPPGFGTFFVEHVRQQLGITLAPIFLVMLARDAFSLAWLGATGRAVDAGDALVGPLAVGVFVFAPEVLRRVIPTQPLPPDWPLRRRLEALCARAGLRYRDILLWRTNSSMGNAMVMGLFPRVRYVFLSDLLLETMTDDQIEAVFAHELGHVVHRHLWWYVAFFATLMLLAAGPMTMLMDQVPWLAGRENEIRQAQVLTVFVLAAFLGAFGFVSRRFERQADVYAARTMQLQRTGPAMLIRHVNPGTELAGGLLVQGGLVPATAGGAEMGVGQTVAGSPKTSAVGEYGAAIVASALDRVARVNNIPVTAHEWLHGSIDSRKRYLHALSADASRTVAFDKSMRRMYWGMLSVMMSLAAWVVVQHGLLGVSV